MDKYLVTGGTPLRGEVNISGAKNASLPIMASSLLTSDEIVLRNVPDLMDIRTMQQLLEMLGKKVEFEGDIVRITETSPDLYEAPYEIVRKMRASIAVMGPLLGRKGKAKISFPGGCNIGPRPIDIHLRGMKELGAEIVVEHGYVWAQAQNFTGKKMNLLGNNGPSVLATENVMMAASLAKGTTVIVGAAAEPEVSDLADCLTGMGARISGAGTSVLTIEGVERLGGVEHSIIPDRIETGSFIAAAGITGGEIKIRKACIAHLDSPIEHFSKAGVEIEILSDDTLIARGRDIRPVEVDTLPYPYFPTDLQAQLMGLLSLADGNSVITEKIFPDRFMHAAEFNRMGANIKVDGPTAVIKGVKKLSGAAVMASDLRAGAGLVIGALAAHGLSEVLRIYHIDRGYEHLEKKLAALGAKIERVPQ
jgi:UDP-N-acetylglucosamine 1-carboxyvinyltransferase